jgi:alpha-N-arabinofuranosidase
LTNPAGTFDFLSTHFVVGTSDTVLRSPSSDFLALSTFALPVELGRRLHAMQRQVNDNPAFAGKTHIAFTEWLYISDRNDAPRDTNMGGAIGAAAFFNMLVKNADIVPIADMTGIMEMAGIWKKRSQVYASPAYYVFQMYASADVVRPVHVVADSGEYSVHQGISRLPEIADVPYLDVVAAKNDAGDTLTLFVVNRHLTRDFVTDIRIGGFSIGPTAQVQTLQSASLFDENTDYSPLNVTTAVSGARTSPGGMKYVFPHASVTVITLKKSGLSLSSIAKAAF